MTDSAVFHDTSGDTFRDESGPITDFPSSSAGAVSSVFGRTGAVIAVTGDYYGAVAAALTGATQASRYAGATTSGAPVSGTFVKGDWVVAQDGHIFVCTSGGTPGTWIDIGGGASFATPTILLGSSAAAGSAGTVIRSDGTIAAFDTTVPSTQAFADSAVIGTAAFAARRDHKHAMPATPVTSIAKTGAAALTGAVTLTGGANVTLTESGNDISIAASGSGTPVLAFSQNFLTGDVAMTNANQYYDGPTVTLGTGTWLLTAQVFCTASGTVTAKLWDGTTVYASGEQSSPGAGASIVFPFTKVVVLGGSTTVKVSCRNNVTGGNIRYRSPSVDTSAINATGLVAVQIA